MKPNPGTVGSIRIGYLDADELREFKRNSKIQELKEENRVALWGFANEVWIWEHDKKARDILEKELGFIAEMLDGWGNPGLYK